MAPHEDRADRAPQERQDVAVQPADRRQRRHLLVRHRARGDARRRGAGARRAGGAAADPAGDIDDLETELVLADLEVVERRLERLEAQIKKKRTDADVHEQTVLVKMKPRLESGRPIRALGLSEDEVRAIRGFTFLSQKPILHCLNLAEKEIARGATLVESFGLAEVAARPGTRVGWVSAVIESEVAQLDGPEQAAFLADLGLTEPAI